MTSKVLLVEDDRTVIHELEAALTGEGFEVVIAHDGVEALRAVQTERPDLVVLDPMLAWLGGTRVRQAPRPDAASTGEPFIVLSARSLQQERVLPSPGPAAKALDAKTLVDRIKSLQRRVSKEAPATLRAGVLELDLERWTVAVNGQQVALTAKEFGVLRMLMNAKGRVLSRAVLWEIVWEHGKEMQFGSRAVDVHIGRLRQKLGAAGSYILTVRDVGYRFEPDSP